MEQPLLAFAVAALCALVATGAVAVWTIRVISRRLRRAMPARLAAAARGSPSSLLRR